MDTDIYDGIKRCMRCGFCRAVCPVFEETTLESGVARGKIQILKAVLDGSLEPREPAVERMFQCTTCRNCFQECPAGVETDVLLEKAREEFGDLIGVEAYSRIEENIKEKGNPYGQEVAKEWEGTPKIAYFPGCTSILRTPEIADSTRGILDTLEEDYGTLTGHCCGSILYRIGKTETAEDNFQKTLEAIKGTGAQILLVSCSGCYRTFTSKYAEALEDKGIEVVHLVDYLRDKMKELDLKTIEETVTYHDPCHLGRHVGKYDEPRHIMESIPGVTIVEMERTKEDARCCGAGGGLAAGFGELSGRIGSARVQDALETRAETLASACPFCYNQLKGRSEDKIKVKDISMLITERLV